jgi:nicotinamide-nucleotide amidase
MRVEIVTIGDELLLGFTLDTNAAHLARELATVGVEVVRRTTVGDEPDLIVSGVRDALDRTGAVITTGGLGPTSDDMTKPSIAKLFGRGMRMDEQILADLHERWRKRFKGELPATNRNQAMVPEGARILVNRHGSAPGIWLEDERGRWVAMLPGVPREMRGMLADELGPLLTSLAAEREKPRVIRSRTLRLTGVAESALADLLGDLARGPNGLPLAYLPGWEGLDLRLTSRELPADAADRALEQGLAALRPIVAPWLYGEGSIDMAEVVLDACRAHRMSIAVAESCTGGLLGARLTSIPGSSDVVLGGVIAYGTKVKQDMLGVSGDVLREHGAVSEPVARQMATGVRERTGADIGMAITGVAGPGGGTPDKPVGTVWLAVDVRGDCEVRRVNLLGDRDEIRRRATQSVLEMTRRRLAND